MNSGISISLLNLTPLHGKSRYLNLFTDCLFRSISRMWAHWPPHAFPHFGEKGGKKETKRLLEQSIVRKVIIDKGRGEMSLLEQDTIKNVFLAYNFFFIFKEKKNFFLTSFDATF